MEHWGAVIALVRIELRRLLKRSAFRVTVLAVGLAALVGAIYFPLALEPATEESDEFVQAGRLAVESSFDFCTSPPPPADPELFEDDENRPPPEVLERMKAQRERARSRRECMPLSNSFMAPIGRTSYAEFFYLPGALTDAFRWIPYAGFAIAFLIGATFGGGDWSGGWMKTFLTWETRRVRIYLSKAVALLIGMVGLYLAAQLWLAVATSLLALFNGSFVGFDAVIWEDLLESSWRGWFMTAVGALLGFALPFGLRKTMAAPLGLAIYVVYEAVVLNLTMGSYRSWGLTTAVLVAGKGYDTEALHSQSPEVASWLLGLGAVVLTAVGTAVFAKGEVTD